MSFKPLVASFMYDDTVNPASWQISPDFAQMITFEARLSISLRELHTGLIERAYDGREFMTS